MIAVKKYALQIRVECFAETAYAGYIDNESERCRALQEGLLQLFQRHLFGNIMALFLGFDIPLDLKQANMLLLKMKMN